MKVLILGGSGMVGHQMYLHLVEKLGISNVSCTLRKKRSYYKSFGVFQEGEIFDDLPLQNFKEVEPVLNASKADVVINCVGLTPRKTETTDSDEYKEINSLLPHRLGKWAELNNARLIHFSTDCVFDGLKGQYTEADIPTAQDPYGKSKFLGEVTSGNSLTLRLSFIGRELEGKTELLEWFISQKNGMAKGFDRFFYSGITTHLISQEVYKLLTKHPNLTGLYHVAGETISKYDLLNLINQIYELGVKLEKSSTQVNDKSLNCDKYAQATGYKIPLWKDMLLEMRRNEKIIYEGSGQ